MHPHDQCARTANTPTVALNMWRLIALVTLMNNKRCLLLRPLMFQAEFSKVQVFIIHENLCGPPIGAFFQMQPTFPAEFEGPGLLCMLLVFAAYYCTIVYK